ncbi:MAG TPA: universal stress protein [Thermodesulfobacteriota bacterium]
MTPATLAPAVIVPLDGTVHATAALPVARGLAALLGSTPCIVHVGVRPRPPREMLEPLKLTSEQLEGSVLHQATGSPAAAIVDLAASRRHALIVMCTHTGLDKPRGALGSVTREVLRTAACPVVLVHPERGPRPWTLRRLLLPHDGTPTSAAALSPAAELARRAGAELTVLHVAVPGSEPPGEPGTCAAPRYLDQPQHEWPAWAREFLDRLRAIGRPPGEVPMRLSFAAGEAGRAIVEFASREASDLIVLAWRGVLEPGRALTARAVVGGASCPILVVRVAA